MAKRSNAEKAIVKGVLAALESDALTLNADLVRFRTDQVHACADALP
jgi:hypothetical protein